MSILMQDLRYALRMLFKNRSFTIVALIVLTLGIGANSAIFSFVNAILLRSLPYTHADRLVRIYSSSPGKEVRTFTSSYPDFLDWKNNNQTFEEMGAWARGSATLTGTDNPERFDTALITPAFFNVLGVSPERGRVFTPEDDKDGSNKVVLISNGVWQRRFGSDPNIIGKQFTLEGTSYSIIGVMPADFNFLFPVDVWMAMSLNGVGQLISSFNLRKSSLLWEATVVARPPSPSSSSDYTAPNRERYDLTAGRSQMRTAKNTGSRSQSSSRTSFFSIACLDSTT